MIKLDEISKVGFGSYRLSLEDHDSYSALEYGLASGCNVVDTAPNYALGDAEQVIGELLKSTDRSKLFLMTKAGYAQGLSTAEIKEIGEKKFSNTTDGGLYSLDPALLRYRLNQSLKRLGTNYVDGFFLHNPHYLAGDENIKIALCRAFEFLEEMADNGIIRYYGISSSALTTNASSVFDIDYLKTLAQHTNSSNRMKLFQFPLNLIENAIINEGQNVIAKCKENGYVTFSNRPLNAFLPNGTLLRLGGFELSKENTVAVKHDYSELLENIQAYLHSRERVTPEWLQAFMPDFTFSSAETLDVFFKQKVYPAERELCEAKQDLSIKILDELHELSLLKIKINMAVQTKSFFDHVYGEAKLAPADYAPLAIRYCQLQGVDCVLNGFRKTNYFKQIIHLVKP